ncbi:cell division transport system permease protein [Ruminococcaceae bacterium KH2T8]|nr:cell division transport system permease protein [Ruminococcaceae bacterium KH2T8]
MSIRAFFNSVKEGFKGITRHPLVTVASITTILLMLIVMSAFFIFSANVRSIMRKLSQEPPIEVYMKLQVSQDELYQTQLMIDQDPDIIESSVNNPEQNYEYFKTNLGSSSSVLDDFDYNMYLPYTFHIRISDPARAQDVVNRLTAMPGVSKVSQESNVMHFLTNAKRIVNLATVVSFIVLFLIALFIISNMVRISVYSRASEIEIMKFVGATNFYIRMPYVIEGALVGLISALCAWVISVMTYRTIFYNAMEGIDLNSFYALIPAGRVMWWVLAIAVVIGVMIGAVGSGISVRKYIKV